MRLIDADAFIKHWNSEWRHLHPDDCYLVALRNFPAVDAVEVVRCKDCVNFDTNNCGLPFSWCDVWEQVTCQNNFCSYGERKEGAD